MRCHAGRWPAPAKPAIHDLDDADVNACIEQMRGEGVPERMQRDASPALVDVGRIDRMHKLTRELTRADRIENAAAAHL